MRGPPILIALFTALFIWALLLLFIVFDTPQRPAAARITPSPSYWHYIDWVDPREDTAHYNP